MSHGLLKEKVQHRLLPDHQIWIIILNIQCTFVIHMYMYFKKTYAKCKHIQKRNLHFLCFYEYKQFQVKQNPSVLLAYMYM